MLHGFPATMRALTSAEPLHSTAPTSPRSLPCGERYPTEEPGPLIPQRPPLRMVTTRRPHPSPHSSPGFTHLTFRPFHLQPPHGHFATVAFPRYITAVTCRSSQIALHPSSRKRSDHCRLQAGNVRLRGACTLLIKRLHRRTSCTRKYPQETSFQGLCCALDRASLWHGHTRGLDSPKFATGPGRVIRDRWRSGIRFDIEFQLVYNAICQENHDFVEARKFD